MLRGFTQRGFVAGCCLAIGIALALMPGSARADADDDEAAAASRSGPPPAPRVDLQNRDFELVAVAQDRNLLIYLDRFNDGEPIGDARIEVDVAGKAVLAAPVGIGAYLATADWVAAPGRHDVRFTLSTKQGSATLAGTLEIPLARTQAGDGESPSSSSPLTISLPVDILLIAALGILWAFAFGILTALRIAKARATAATARPQLRTVTAGGERPPGRRAA
jgi:hypothetical protein